MTHLKIDSDIFTGEDPMRILKTLGFGEDERLSLTPPRRTTSRARRERGNCLTTAEKPVFVPFDFADSMSVRQRRSQMRPWKRLLPLAVAFALTAVLAACGSGSSTGVETPVVTSVPFPAPDSTIDECSLVTPVELTQIISGQPFTTGAPGHYLCNFTNGADRVSVYAVDYLTDDRTLQEFRARASGPTPTDVPSLGEAAFWQSDGNQLSVRKSTVLIVVQVFTAKGDEANRNAAVSIARIALGRLPTASPSASVS
jgi:hypothetical protein